MSSLTKTLALVLSISLGLLALPSQEVPGPATEPASPVDTAAPAGAEGPQAATEPASVVDTPTPAGAATPAGADGPEGYAGRVVGPLGGTDGLLAGDLGIVTFDELDGVLVWRDGRSPQGVSALRQMLELRLLKHLAEQQKVVISDEALLQRFEQLDADARREGVPGGLAEYIANQGVTPAEFREYLRLAMIHETLTRRALGLAEDAELTADQQQLWLDNTLKSRPYAEQPHPWSEGVVCTSGDLTITRAEFAAHLRKQISVEDRKEAIYLILLERAVRARMPEISDEGVTAALDREIERRTQEAEQDPRYQGAAYEQLLDARGLSLASLRRDPAIRAAALAHEFVDRANDDAALRGVYDAEREYFDGLFGESVEVRLVFKNATDRDDDPLRPSFKTVEDDLRTMAEAIESPAEFLRVIEIHSEDRASRENGGLIGRITRGATGVPKPLREAVFEALEAAARTEGSTVEGSIVGPIRMQNGVLLAMLTARKPAPTWETMKVNVHRDLRRRFLEETLMRASVLTYLDEQ